VVPCQFVFTIMIRIHEPKRRLLLKKKKLIGNKNFFFKGATREWCCYQMIGDKLYIQDEEGNRLVYVHILSYAKTLPYNVVADALSRHTTQQARLWYVRSLPSGPTCRCPPCNTITPPPTIYATLHLKGHPRNLYR
jgi:hypothetical protein